MNKIIDILKRIKISNILCVFIFIILLPITLIVKGINKLKGKEIWLISEEKDKARDNGYHFFKYLMNKDTKYDVYYAIDKNCNDYKKIKKYDKNIIKYGSVKHYFIYMVANKNIVSQKSANPNPPLFYVLHVLLKVYNNRIFLQHGIILNKCDSLLYKNTHFKKIICSCEKEYKYINSELGYPKDKICMTGLARFDNLTNKNLNKKQIVIMPSWRNYLSNKKNNINFKETSYYINWIKILTDSKLINKVKEKNITIYFYVHPNMEKYIKNFKSKSENIKIVNSKQMDIQDLFNTSSLMITDYSSVSMDFLYLNKPVIYFQFDNDIVREKQYKKGYYNYDFGYNYKDYKKVISKTIEYIDNKFKLEDKYQNKINDFFIVRDNSNCDRIYNELKE